MVGTKLAWVMPTIEQLVGPLRLEARLEMQARSLHGAAMRHRQPTDVEQRERPQPAMPRALPQVRAAGTGRGSKRPLGQLHQPRHAGGPRGEERRSNSNSRRSAGNPRERAFDLRAGEAHVQGHEDSPHPPQGVEQDHQLWLVGRLHRHPLARPHTLCLERPTRRLHQGVELRPRPGVALPDERRRVRLPLGRRAHRALGDHGTPHPIAPLGK